MIKLFFSIFLFTTVANAQYFDWAKSIGGITQDNVEDLTVDNFGNLYITGSFSGTVDFDPGLGVYNLTSNGLEDIFVLKLDKSGQFVRAKSFGGNGDDAGNSIAIDSSGNIYITGYFENTIDFDPGSGVFLLTAYGIKDIFIQKLDSNSNLLWATSMGGSLVYGDEGKSITTDLSGNIYTTGYFAGNSDFDPGNGAFNLYSNYNSVDIFIQKLDANGNFVWAKSIVGLGTNIAYSIITDVNGYIYTTGEFSNTVDFDPGSGVYNLSSHGSSDIFIQKLDPSGNFVWAKSMGGISSDLGESITTDASGNVYTTGYFYDIVDFDPGVGIYNLTSNGLEDIFVIKLDSNGDFIWAKSMGGTSSDIGSSITKDVSGNVYTTGSFKNTVDFDPGIGVNNLSSIWATDAFISKLDSNGDFVWAESMGGGAEDEGVSIKVDNYGNIYSVGTFDGGVNFNPFGSYILQSNGFKDIFISKLLSQCSNGIINTSPTLSALDTNASYQWLDCVSNYSLISGATSQSYTPAINGIYAVEITTNYCVDTSVCELVYNVDIIENTFIINLYPNPTNGEFIVEFTSKINGDVVISNTLGQTVAEYKIYDKTMRIPLNNLLLRGIYFIHIVDVNYRIINTRKILLN